MPLPETISIEGHAIVSVDGMIADREGEMPPALRNDADWRDFQAALDRAALVVLGRHGHRRHPNPGRRRLVATSTVPGLMPDEIDPAALLWNPTVVPFEAVLAGLGIASGVVAVTGGTRVFDLFLATYSRFVLAEVDGLVLPGGTPCFMGGHPRSVLAQGGLRPERARVIDVGVTQTVWAR